jgi:hypothetical protein
MRAQQVKLEAYCLMKDWMLNRVIRDEGYRSKTLKCPGQEEITVMVTSQQVQKESDLEAFMDNPPRCSGMHQHPKAHHRTVPNVRDVRSITRGCRR